MYARNMEHLIIYPAFGYAHDIQLINHLVYTKTPRRLNRVYSPLDFWIGFDEKFDDIPILILIRKFGELPIHHHFFSHKKTGVPRVFRRSFASNSRFWRPPLRGA